MHEVMGKEAPMKISPLPVKPASLKSRIQKFLGYCGPGYMIAVGYMDPGNWATDIEAGSRFGYSLLFVILLSTVMAVVLQHLCVRMGIYTQLDLAQNCRKHCRRDVNLFLYVIAELAIISCDLSDVIGTAIALNLLFGLPILWGVIMTVLDVLLLLNGFESLMAAKSEAEPTRSSPSTMTVQAYKWLEWLVMVLMGIVGACFLLEMILVGPNWTQVLLGFIPKPALLLTNKDALFSALGILGATVMPHNLYLHSAIVKYSLAEDQGAHAADHKPAESDDAPREPRCPAEVIHYNTIDTIIALFLALLINAAILIVAAAAFHARGRLDVQHIEDAHGLMKEWLGRPAALLFALALLAAGQSSTVTGTLAGQIVFEGFLNLKMRPWLRRLLTRMVAIVPAIAIILMAGEHSVNQLLLYSQVILSFQLPFAIIPLIIFTFQKDSDSSEPASSSASRNCLYYGSWCIAAVIIGLNMIFPFLTFI